MAWLSGYTYRKKKPANSTTAGAQTNYQMELLVGESSGASGEEIDCEGHCQDFPNDIRFTKEDGTTKHDYWVESISGGSPNRLATIQIEVAATPASGDIDLYMYYGKSGDSGESNGVNTFEFFDDFVGTGGSSYASMHNLLKGKPWTRDENNPILEKSASGWDSYGVRDPILMINTSGNLVQESGDYIMYYDGYENGGTLQRKIGRATSPDGVNWTKYASNPVLEKGAAEQWDETGVWIGSVVKKGANDYIMYYAGFSGTVYGVGLAESTDGINWTKYANNPILEESDFTLGGAGVISLPYCIKLSNGNWVLYFEGTPGGGGFNIYGAQSTDSAGKTSWAALNSGDAVIEDAGSGWDAYSVANPKICEIANGKYIIGYNGCSSTSDNYKLGFAESTNLVDWTKYSENPVMDLGNSEDFDDYRIENTLIAKDDVGTNSVRMWYFGCPGFSGISGCAIGYATCDQNAVKGGNIDWTSRWQSALQGNYEIEQEILKLKTSTTGWGNAIYSQPSFSGIKAIYYKIKFNSISDVTIYSGLSKDKPLTDWIFLFDTQYGLRYKNTSASSIVIWGSVAGNKQYEVTAIKKDTNTWHFELYENGVEKVNLDKTDVTAETSKYFVFLRLNSVNIGYIDNTLVRKYADPEPTWGTSGSEETAPEGGHPTMARWHGIPGMKYIGRAGVSW